MWLLAVLCSWQVNRRRLRPDARPKAEAQAPRIRLVAAGGECVGAQIVVQGPVQHLVATATEGLALYRVATIDLKFPSGPDGVTANGPTR